MENIKLRYWSEYNIRLKTNYPNFLRYFYSFGFKTFSLGQKCLIVIGDGEFRISLKWSEMIHRTIITDSDITCNNWLFTLSTLFQNTSWMIRWLLPIFLSPEGLLYESPTWDLTIFLSSEIYLAFSLRSDTQDTVLVFSLFLLDFPSATVLLGGETLNLERLAWGAWGACVSPDLELSLLGM